MHVVLALPSKKEKKGSSVQLVPSVYYVISLFDNFSVRFLPIRCNEINVVFNDIFSLFTVIL